MFNGTSKPTATQVSAYEAEVLSQRCFLFLRPFLAQLMGLLDRRLVKTCLDVVLLILIHRHRQTGLLMSELGDQLLGADQGPAGTKRIAKLLHSSRWVAELITAFLWEQGAQAVQALLHPQEDVYVIWDESVIEKAESLQAEGLCAVRSTKAARLSRIKPGYFNPPGGRPIFVPGYHWLQLIVTGPKGVLTLAHLRFWTTRGDRKSDTRSEETQILAEVAKRWGKRVVHVWDRGFAGAPWTQLALDAGVRFVLRWKKNYLLVGPNGQPQKPWEITRGKRSWEHRMVWDARRRCQRKTGVIAVPVHLPDDPRPLWLVVSRPGKGRKPWYLVTNEPVETPADAWRVVFAYARRWQVEVSIRFTKTELAFEGPRLQKWDARLKFWGLAALAYAFLLSLLHTVDQPGGQWLLRTWCRRDEKRGRKAPIPFYRVRIALSRLWTYFRPRQLPKLNLGLNPG